MFIEGNPDLKNKVKYWLYYRIFTEEYNISFGFPRSDVCDKCEYYMAKIKASEAEGNNDETNAAYTGLQSTAQTREYVNVTTNGGSAGNHGQNQRWK